MGDDHRQDADTIPAGVACTGCRYELAGLPRGGVCPECGLDAPASWPVYDLRRCARPYVANVLDELRVLNWVTIAAWVVLASAAIAGLGAAFEGRGGGVAIAAMSFGLLAVAGLVPLPLLVLYAWSALAQHPNTRTAPGGAERVRLGRALLVAQLGLWGVLGLGLLAGFLDVRVAWPAFVAAMAIALIGLGWACLEALAYAAHVLDRAGRACAGRAVVLGWGFAFVVLGVVAAGSAFVDLGRPLALTAASVALLGPATALALRLARARAVVGVIADGKRAPDTP
ncbi:MAG: hypothetical protein RIE77_12705 [Phycisphaerales bacterium]|jgi:hypothetical protein